MTIFEMDIRLPKQPPRDNLKHSISPIDQKVASGSHLKNMAWFFTKEKKNKKEISFAFLKPSTDPTNNFKRMYLQSLHPHGDQSEAKKLLFDV